MMAASLLVVLWTLAGGRGGTLSSAAQWHLARRKALLEHHPEAAALTTPDGRTLPALLVVNAAQFASALAFAHAPPEQLVPLAFALGGTLSVWQFSCLHDVRHGSAALPFGLRRDRVLFWASMPSAFGYQLYLAQGHMSHHRGLGRHSLQEVFDSSAVEFEDGDTLFVAHRSLVPGDSPSGSLPATTSSRPTFIGRGVGGLGVSISRTFYALLWSERLGWVYNMFVYASSMAVERLALCFNDKVVAITGYNAFFPNKPDRFHASCAAYARVNSLLQAVLLLAAGPGALAWLLVAELAWQIPPHPAAASFLSNHPSIATDDGATCQPTASVYFGAVWDGLSANINYHTEHHDLPQVPLWRLPRLRALAPEFYEPPYLHGVDVSYTAALRRAFSERAFYACANDQQLVAAAPPVSDRTGAKVPTSASPMHGNAMP